MMRIVPAIMLIAVLSLGLTSAPCRAGTPVNINTAGVEELNALPHIGKTTAEKIIAYRTEHGPFQSTADLGKVPGLGASTLAKLEGLITVGAAKASEAEEDEASAEAEEVAPSRVKEILARFDHEPSIRDVHAAAMKYADLHPERVLQWWSDVRYRALLPETRVTVDHDTNDNHQRTTQSKIDFSDDILTVLPDTTTRKQDTDDNWSLQLSATWDLPELIFSRDMLEVADQSESLQKMRRSVLDDVTKLYFERRRLQVQMALRGKPGGEGAIKDELRLQELTAGLDALTGNYFSDELKKTTGK